MQPCISDKIMPKKHVLTQVKFTSYKVDLFSILDNQGINLDIRSHVGSERMVKISIYQMIFILPYKKGKHYVRQQQSSKNTNYLDKESCVFSIRVNTNHVKSKMMQNFFHTHDSSAAHQLWCHHSRKIYTEDYSLIECYYFRLGK